MGKKLHTTDSTLSGYIIMSIVCTLYVYQESALNHMQNSITKFNIKTRKQSSITSIVKRFSDALRASVLVRWCNPSLSTSLPSIFTEKVEASTFEYCSYDARPVLCISCLSNSLLVCLLLLSAASAELQLYISTDNVKTGYRYLIKDDNYLLTEKTDQFH